MPIGRVLVANRGEIALRVIRALREMGIESVAVFSEVDRKELHVRAADAAYLLGGPAPADSYLRIDKLLEVAQAAGCDAVHPGYGFLSENAEFARRVEEAALVFIGPTAESIAAAGDKLQARRAMAAAGVPVIPGSETPVRDLKTLKKRAKAVGYPVVLKAVGGGGGKGIRVVEKSADLESALARARGEAESAFGNAEVYVEKFLRAPRHIEIQVLADTHGNTVHLGERECSVQRRHQKLLEEAPSPFLDAALRARMGEAAVKAARAVSYRGAGTVEFLVDDEKNFYFLEMNTRIQVEHPVTELVYGHDLVRLQVLVAQGEPLPFGQEDLLPHGHAIEIRLTAEDPFSGFLPETGTIRALRLPQGPGIRVDSHLYPGQELTLHYDPMIGKVIAWGQNRTEAVARLRRALLETRIVGVRTCAPLLLALLSDSRFLNGQVHTEFLEAYVEEQGWRAGPAFGGIPLELAAVITAVLHAHRRQGAARAVVVDPARAPRSAWLDQGRIEAMR